MPSIIQKQRSIRLVINNSARPPNGGDSNQQCGRVQVQRSVGGWLGRGEAGA
jgi:hypothetical protein